MGRSLIAAACVLASAGSLGLLLPVGTAAQDGPLVTTTVLVLPVTPVAVAPGQPAVGSAEAATPDLEGLKKATPTAGIINAVCSVTLNIVGCGFFPDEVSLGCDSDGDGTVDLIIPLTDIKIVNRLLFRATLAPDRRLPGTPFPLSCCGGIATLTLTRRIGLLTQSLNIDIDLGLRAPVLLSVTPTTFDCSSAQNLLLPGGCFLTPAGLPNVSRVFAVDRSNPQNIVEAARFSILSSSLIDADFSFGAGNAGKTFLFFVEGPNGRSRNLTSLPPGAGSSCPLGNEAGVQVRVSCAAAPPAVPLTAPLITDCVLSRTESGKLVLTVTGLNIHRDAAVTINGGRAKKTKFRDLDLASNRFRSIDLIGKFCGLLPGPIVIVNPDGETSPPFQCGHTCQ